MPALKIDIRLAASVAEQARERGLEAAAKHLLDTANKTCPKDTGALRDSGEVETDPGSSEVRVKYKKFYASWVHENSKLKFKPPGRHKWLQMAAAEEADTMLEIVGNAVRDALG
jgi:hypothetical protein